MSNLKAPKNIRIGFTHYDPKHIFWNMHAWAVTERVWQTDMNLAMIPVPTVPTQVEAIKHLTAQGVDVLIVGTIDGTDPATIAAVQETIAAGIPVIATNMAISQSQVSCTVRSDDFKGGELAGQYLVEQLGGDKCKIAVIAPPAPMPRYDGFHSVMDAQPNCQLVFEAKGDWSRESGARVMRQALAACPDLRAVFAVAEQMAHGALDVLQSAGRAGEILLIGYDGFVETFRAIHAGEMRAVVIQSPYEMGKIAVDMAMALLRGETVSPLVLTDVKLITPHNVVETLLNMLSLFPDMMHSLAGSNDTQQGLHQKIIETQQQAIQELSTPIIPIMDNIIVMPLIGSIDTLRARDITRALLAGITTYHAKVVILDITGVPIVDSGVAGYLNKTIQAARLKGAQVMITGITEAVAETIIDLGIDWHNIETRHDLQTGLMAALTNLGLKLVPR